MIKKIILSLVILICSSVGSYALVITITPISTSDPLTYEGTTKDYTVTYQNLLPGHQFQLIVVNGTAIPVTGQGPVPTLIRIKWDCVTGSGTIILREVNTLIQGTFSPVITSFISDPTNYCNNVMPVKQDLLIGQTAALLYVSYCSPICSAPNVFYHYQWQVGDVAIGTFPQVPTIWTDITNANNENYQPPSSTTECIKAYRRITTFTFPGTGGVDVPYTMYSNIAVISSFYALNPGTITEGQTGITQTPASGGLCDGFNYVYSWEWSLDNGNSWVTISSGNSIDFPISVSIPATFTIVRRKVICGIGIGYSNNLYFNPPALIPGSINYNGPTSLPYNSVPDISQLPASGSICNAGDYIYTWERSINNSGWVPIGPVGISSINYPAGVGLIGNTRFRRKVKCAIENVYHEAYSNILSFTLTGVYTPPTPENLNYIRTKTVLMPGIGTLQQLDNLNTGEQIQQTEYFDELGRKIQTVLKQNSPLQKDMVSINEYDQLSRESIKRLPFVSTPVQIGNVDNDGKFKSNALVQQAAFYNGTNSPINGQGETFFYGQVDFEASPLNRVLKTFAPGNSWVGTSGTGISNEKSQESQYLLNTKNGDAVKIFTMSGGFPVSVDTYNDGELYKTISIDESKHQVVEFKDKLGNVILKKVQLVNTVTDGHSGWLCTYYIYDNFGLLKFVLPPKATELYLTGTVIATIADQLCFSYEYDQRHRLIMKKIPGAAKSWMVYDQRDRLIMMQDGNLGTPPTGIMKKWMVTEYDLLNRPVRTGLLSDNNDQAYHAFHASQSTSSYPDVSTGYELLTETYYDNYDWTTGTPMPSIIDASNFNNSYFETANIGPLYASPLAADYNTKGLITGTKVKILESTGQYEYSVNFYDDRKQIIQTQKTNLTGGKNTLTMQFDFSGKVLRTLSQQQIVPSGNSQTHLISTIMQYDHAGRLLKANKYLKSNVNSHDIVSFPRKTLVENSYNELGQLKTKKLGQKPGTTSELETLTYDYNIRGWLLGMNRDYLIAQGQSGTVRFGFELGYNKLGNKTGQNFIAQQYNGNVTGMIWKSDGDDVRRKYDFAYDNSNRLLKASFEQQNNDDLLWNKNQVDYTVNMGDGSNPVSAYDANGNIKAMTQFGLKLGVSPTIPIDDLTYFYKSSGNSNQLLQVLDGNNDKDSKLGDFKYDPATKTLSDYTYDANGNLKVDINKNIINYNGSDGILYNHLNLPTTIFIKKDGTANKGVINYTYDATGSKLKKTVIEYDVSVPHSNGTYTSNITTTTDYIDGFIYETKAYSNTALSALQYNYTLQTIAHEEGRIRLDPGDYTVSPPVYGKFYYDFFIKDNLGNVRMVITDEEKQDMYPAATMENALIPTEETFYSNLPQTRVTLPAGYPANSPSGNEYVAMVNGLYGGGSKMGPGIVLKVMAGDKFSAQVNSWYLDKIGSGPENPNGIITDLLNALTNGVGNLPGSKASPSELDNAGVFLPGAYTFLDEQTNTADPLRPWAFLNWVLFDEQFNYVASSSGFDQVPLESYYNNSSAPNNRTMLHVQPDMPLERNGFLFVYVSNETPNINVFFDNLQVTHIKGPILEETHYYPYGLVMHGISSKSAGSLMNKYKYNGKEEQRHEFSDGSGLESLDYGARMYNNQIGRWNHIDPLSEKMRRWSPYNFAFDNPIRFVDADGMKPDEWVGTQEGDKITWTWDPNIKSIEQAKADKNFKGLNVVDVKATHDFESNGGRVYLWADGSATTRTKEQYAESTKEAAFFSGQLDMAYSLGTSGYDHDGYYTTKGVYRPSFFRSNGSFISARARSYWITSQGIQGLGVTFSGVSTYFSGVQVYNQYMEGGINNVDPVDAASLTVGTVGTISSAMTWFGYGGRAAFVVSRFAGPVGVGIGSIESWRLVYQPMTDLSNWRGYYTGNQQYDSIRQVEISNGIYNWTDYFNQ
jgi:RHS repeat-associated protein